MSLVIGIDASRCRSGGAVDHIIGVLSAGNAQSSGIHEVHIWSYKALMDKLPDFHWLVKHSPPDLEYSLFRQIWWQYHYLPIELNKYNCNLLFSADAGTVCPYNPMVVLSQDSLSYEPGIMKRFGITLKRLRLLLLLYIQNRSMRYAEGVIFLTEYAANLVQKSTGKLKQVALIPHGIDQAFNRLTCPRVWPKDSIESIRCIYVSDVAIYKNQWEVVRGLKKLRDRGYNLELRLVGSSTGSGKRLLNKEISKSDPNGLFVKIVGFISHVELPNLIASSDIFIFASSCETMPITLLEGMASGLPIACSNRGPMPEVLGDGGVYFDPENPDSIALAIENIIINKSLRSFIARRAKHLSQQYYWTRCASETWDFLCDIARG